MRRHLKIAVAGNMPVEKTTKNALDVLNVSGMSHIAVVQGQAGPLMRPPRFCPEIHGTYVRRGRYFRSINFMIRACLRRFLNISF